MIKAFLSFLGVSRPVFDNNAFHEANKLKDYYRNRSINDQEKLVELNTAIKEYLDSIILENPGTSAIVLEPGLYNVVKVASRTPLGEPLYFKYIPVLMK